MQCYPFIHSDDPDCAEAADKLELVCAHDCPAQPLQRAFHELDGHTAKRGLHQGWWWSLADQSADNKAGDCPNFAESSEQNGTVPFARDTPKTADIFEDVTFEHDTAAQQQLEKVLAARLTVSHSIAAIDRLDRQRRNDRRSPRRGLAGHHRGDGRAESSQQNVPVPISAGPHGHAPPPSTTGHPILDAILDEFRKPPPATSPQHAIPDTFTPTTP
jgi:hypothetical protein